MINIPYMQASGNQIVDMLETLVNACINVTVILGAMILVLMVWLCFSELRQSKKRRRVIRSPRMDQPQRPPSRQPTRDAALPVRML
jgi:hypothetical protein